MNIDEDENYLRLAVCGLRKNGKTYSEIINSIGTKIPKSTLSNWCKDVILPLWYEEKIKRPTKTNLD